MGAGWCELSVSGGGAGSVSGMRAGGLFRLCVTVLALLCVAPHATGQSLRVLTEEWPPFNFKTPEGASGLAADLARLLLDDAGLATQAEFMPWNRVYQIAQHTPNVLIFTLARTPERESQFEWVLKVSDRAMSLYRLKSRPEVKVPDLESAKQYRVGTGPKSDTSTQFLLRSGFIPGRNLEPVQTEAADRSNLRKLVAGRIDLMVSHPLTIEFTADRIGIDSRQLERALTLPEKDAGYWIALSKQSDPVLLARLRAAAVRLEKDGGLEKIRRRYLTPERP